MTTKHRAEELADSFLSAPYEIDFRQWVEIRTLLRTIPAMEAEIAELKHKLAIAEIYAERNRNEQ